MKDIKLFGILIFLLSIVSGVIGQLLLKKGVTNLSFDLSNLSVSLCKSITNLYLLSWILFAGISAILWIIVVSRFELSFAFPAAISLSSIFIVLLSGWLFGETISVTRWIGIVILCLGVFLVSK